MDDKLNHYPITPESKICIIEGIIDDTANLLSFITDAPKLIK